jgi:hypothetical protein
MSQHYLHSESSQFKTQQNSHQHISMSQHYLHSASSQFKTEQNTVAKELVSLSTTYILQVPNSKLNTQTKLS